MRRLKCEKETIILTNEDDGFYDVYTFNQSLQKRLRSFAEKYPDDCWLKGSSEDGSETYMIKKGRLSLNLRPPYSKDRITERAIEGFIECDLREKSLMTMRKNESKIR